MLVKKAMEMTSSVGGYPVAANPDLFDALNRDGRNINPKAVGNLLMDDRERVCQVDGVDFRSCWRGRIRNPRTPTRLRWWRSRPEPRCPKRKLFRGVWGFPGFCPARSLREILLLPPLYPPRNAISARGGLRKPQETPKPPLPGATSIISTWGPSPTLLPENAPATTARAGASLSSPLGLRYLLPYSDNCRPNRQPPRRPFQFRPPPNHGRGDQRALRERRQWLADIFVRPLRRRADCPPGGTTKKMHCTQINLRRSRLLLILSHPAAAKCLQFHEQVYSAFQASAMRATTTDFRPKCQRKCGRRGLVSSCDPEHSDRFFAHRVALFLGLKTTPDEPWFAPGRGPAQTVSGLKVILGGLSLGREISFPDADRSWVLRSASEDQELGDDELDPDRDHSPGGDMRSTDVSANHAFGGGGCAVPWAHSPFCRARPKPSARRSSQGKTAEGGAGVSMARTRARAVEVEPATPWPRPRVGRWQSSCRRADCQWSARACR